MKPMRRGGLGLLIVTLLLSSFGCAQLSPQQIDFKPTIGTDHLIKGQGSVELMVVDARLDRIIGTRGGTYKETSTITAARPLAQVIEQLALKVMTEAGLEVTSNFADYQMQIRLDELSYKTEKYRPSIKRTTVNARITVEVSNGNRTFKNSYQSSQYQDTVGYPSEDKNAELLNAVFNNVLNGLFNDAALSEFLQQ